MVVSPVLSVPEVARLLRTSERSVLALIRKKKLPATKVGREYRITEEAVNAFLKDPQNFPFCAHKDGIIWGIGKTPKQAIEDAIHWMFQHEPRPPNIDQIGLTVSPCSWELYDRVMQEGGDISFVFDARRGIVTLDDEPA